MKGSTEYENGHGKQPAMGGDGNVLDEMKSDLEEWMKRKSKEREPQDRK